MIFSRTGNELIIASQYKSMEIDTINLQKTIMQRCISNMIVELTRALIFLWKSSKGSYATHVTQICCLTESLRIPNHWLLFKNKEFFRLDIIVKQAWWSERPKSIIPECNGASWSVKRWSFSGLLWKWLHFCFEVRLGQSVLV